MTPVLNNSHKSNIVSYSQKKAAIRNQKDVQEAVLYNKNAHEYMVGEREWEREVTIA